MGVVEFEIPTDVLKKRSCKYAIYSLNIKSSRCEETDVYTSVPRIFYGLNHFKTLLLRECQHTYKPLTFCQN